MNHQSRFSVVVLVIALLSLLLIANKIALAEGSIESTTTTVFERRVSFSTGDAEEFPVGDIRLGSSDLDLGFVGSNPITVGVLFNDVVIPPGASIQNAYVQFKADKVNSNLTNLVIQAETSDDAFAFRNTENFALRPLTAISVTWQVDPWLFAGEAGPAQQTPDISALIQEIVDRPGWVQGNALALIITGDGERAAKAFDSDPGGAPLLHVEYTGSPNPTPTEIFIGNEILFGVIGDYGIDSAPEAAVAGMVQSWLPDFVITTGDNNYPDGEAATIDINIGKHYQEFIGNYQGTYGPGSVENRFWPSLGNHDWHVMTCGTACSGPYFD